MTETNKQSDIRHWYVTRLQICNACKSLMGLTDCGEFDTPDHYLAAVASARASCPLGKWSDAAYPKTELTPATAEAQKKEAVGFNAEISGLVDPAASDTPACCAQAPEHADASTEKPIPEPQKSQEERSVL